MPDAWREAFTRRENGTMDDAEARRLSAVFWNSYMPSMSIVVESAENRLERVEQRPVEHAAGPLPALRRMLGLSYKDEQAKNDAVRKAKAELMATYEQSDSYIRDYMRLSGNTCAIYTPRRIDLLGSTTPGAGDVMHAGTSAGETTATGQPRDVFNE